jgi:hypothetical protein
LSNQPVSTAFVRVAAVDHGSEFVAVPARTSEKKDTKYEQKCKTHGLQRLAHAPVKNALSSMWRLRREKASGTENCMAARLYLKNPVGDWLQRRQLDTRRQTMPQSHALAMSPRHERLTESRSALT